MKLQVSILFFGNMLLAQALTAQSADNGISFKYRCVPTSTTDYSIEIGGDKFILYRTEKIPGKKERIRKTVFSHYTHSFHSKEKVILDSIIKANNLDSPGLYQDRQTEWGTLWEIVIHRNSITYNIDLPNYNNAGLESLIHFIVCLIPKKELPPFECKRCSLKQDIK
jgi:hypothetical protein